MKERKEWIERRSEYIDLLKKAGVRESTINFLNANGSRSFVLARITGKKPVDPLTNDLLKLHIDIFLDVIEKEGYTLISDDPECMYFATIEYIETGVAIDKASFLVKKTQ